MIDQPWTSPMFVFKKPGTPAFEEALRVARAINEARAELVALRQGPMLEFTSIDDLRATVDRAVADRKRRG